MARRPRVLVAEDDRDLLEAVAVAIENLGAEVVRVETGGELVERMADEGPFDLVVSDIAMPWMDGLQALRAVRTAGIDVPFIIMTALDLGEAARRVAPIGANTAILRKPFELAELEDIVARVLPQPSS